jgi:hypothetical protein
VERLGKFAPVLFISTEHQDTEAYWRSGGIAPLILKSALDGGERSVSHPGRFTPKERAPSSHWLGGWVGLRAGLDAVVKRNFPSPCRDANPRSSIP